MAKFIFSCFILVIMSMIADYKTYRKFVPDYAEWKSGRDLADAKRVEYLRKNPNEIKQEDIQKSKAILRAIDIMDEYSQSRAENAEVATETVVNTGLEIASSIGIALGFGLSMLKPIRNFFKKYLGKLANYNKNSEIAVMTLSLACAGIAGTIAAFPLFSWAARAEVKAARKGRFEAINTELSNPKTFAILTPEQEEELNSNLNLLAIKKEDKKRFKNLKESWKTVKDIVIDSKEYKSQKIKFDNSLKENEKYFDEKLTEKEIEDAKKDQQLLTKLVEKIDIASQDYAENAELATSTLMTSIFAFGSLFMMIYNKIATKLNIKIKVLPNVLGFAAMLGSSIFAAQIQKEASRVGRFKTKQDLIKNPEQLVYVSDEKTGEIKDIEIKSHKKQSIFKFLKNAWKNDRDYKKWKKNEGAIEKNYTKALENIEFTEEQIKDAERLQQNTFKTFNKIDENSQKYAESLEALGQSIQYPITSLFSLIGILFAMKYLTNQISNAKKLEEMATSVIKYFSIILLSTLPSIGINAYITKEQKNASRVANMLAINEMQDYRNFADYSRFK